MLKCATPLMEGIYSAAIASQSQEAKKMHVLVQYTTC
jgi:dihydroxyacetone kinase DhaKLM complex PTS-EIIA-like component DhaM